MSQRLQLLLITALAGGLLLCASTGCRKERVVERSDAAADAGECSGVLRDCDHRRDTGCETRIGTVAHCGGCDDRCADGETCMGAHCGPAGDLAMSGTHTCVLEASGTVRCWGANESGELGDGTTVMRDRPVTVAGVDAVQLVVRDRLTCVRTRTGAVLCWGEGRSEAGKPDAHGHFEIAALHGAIDLALADTVFCGLLSNGNIHCLPFKRIQPEAGPPPGEPITDAVDIAATTDVLCAARRDGRVTCWDLNPSRSAEPAERQSEVPDVTDAVALTASGGTVCAMRPDGKAKCWGGAIVTTATPFRETVVVGTHDFGGLGPMSDLAFVGWPDTEDCGTRAAGETVCWPPPSLRWSPPSVDAEAERRGLTLKTKPVRLPPAMRIEATQSPLSHCALARAGDVYCWGDLARGRLGVARPPEQTTPRPVDGVMGVRDVVASDFRACARTSTGALHCWGGGKAPHPVASDGVERLLSGRCATVRGELTCFEEPFERPLPASGLKDVVQVVPADMGPYKLSYYARNKRGEISRIDWEQSTTADPRWSRHFVGRVRGLEGIKELFASDRRVCARDATSMLRCWEGIGDPKLDAEGQVTITVSTHAILAGFEQLQLGATAGSPEICGVREGKVGCWRDGAGLQWLDVEGVRRLKISAYGTSCALLANGTLSCWGGPGAMSGHGSLSGPKTPTIVAGLSGVVDWSYAQESYGGAEAVYVWQRDGRLLAWGLNGRDAKTGGQLGWVGPMRLEQPTKVE